MEFENLSEEQVEYQVHRVAIAFEVAEWDEELAKDSVKEYVGEVAGLEIAWGLRGGPCGLRWITIGDGEGGRYFHLIADKRDKLFCAGDTLFAARMARGLYRLGLQDRSVWADLPPLSSHEKLELRLSMPREFWPQKWLDEESA